MAEENKIKSYNLKQGDKFVCYAGHGTYSQGKSEGLRGAVSFHTGWSSGNKDLIKARAEDVIGPCEWVRAEFDMFMV